MMKPKPCGPVEAFLPAIVWRASQCGWVLIGKSEHGHDVWKKPNGQQMIIRPGCRATLARKADQKGAGRSRRPVIARARTKLHEKAVQLSHPWAGLFHRQRCQP